MAVQLSTYSEPLEGPSRMGKNMNTSSLSMSAPNFMSIDDKTIEDFGAQWTQLTENTGYYGSVELLRDFLEPLLPLSDIKGKRVAEIGSGTGRIVNMLLAAGVGHIVALEPSDAISILRANTKNYDNRITYVHERGSELPRTPQLDFVLSIGVIHHIHDPEPVIRRANEALKQNGKFLIWIYGCEGNELYLRFIQPLRKITTVFPDPILRCLSHLLTFVLLAYIQLCRLLPMPMREYMLRVIGKYTYNTMFLTFFDQLNPAHAYYYKENEARALLESAGFSDVKLVHRHGYSWTVIGTKS